MVPNSQSTEALTYNIMNIVSEKNDTVNKWALSLVKNVARVEQLRMFAGSWFGAEGAATENERSARWRLERGMIKSPREVHRRRVSRHSPQTSVRYNGAASWRTRYIKQHSLYETLASMGSQCNCCKRGRDELRGGALRTKRAARFWTR